MVLPTPEREIRLLAVRSLRGANFWSPGPVTRVDVAPGAYDEISSAEIPGFTESLLGALPGLVEHRCSVGKRGGFVTRLERGTYAPHIIEHVALELQAAIGHDVSFGRARGGDAPGIYTVVFEHRHGRVGARAAELAVRMVRAAFAGTLAGSEAELTELASLAREPDEAPPRATVACAVTGGALRADAVRELRSRIIHPPDESFDALVIEVSPRTILETGLPYDRSRLVVITDTRVVDLPDRYRDPDVLRHLISVVAEAVLPDGWIILPADDHLLRERVAGTGRRIALFGGNPSRLDYGEATPAAFVRDGRIVVRQAGVDRIITPPVRPPRTPRALAILASVLLAEAGSLQEPRKAPRTARH